MVATSSAPTSARLRRIRLRARSSAKRSRTAINALTTAPRLSVKTRATAMMTRARKGRYRRGGARHDDQGEEGQVPAGGLLSPRGRVEQAAKRWSSGRGTTACQQIADAEKDQHRQPGTEVVRVREGPGEPPRGRRVPPPQQPRLGAEIVEQAEKREAAAEDQEGAHQPIELRAGPDQMDHQHVRAGV